MSQDAMASEVGGKAWLGEARRIRALADNARAELNMIGQPPNIEIRLSRGGTQILQVFIPPAALRWLDERGMGVDYLAEALSGTALDRLLQAQAPAPTTSDHLEAVDAPAVELRGHDGKPKSPGVIPLEFWLKEHAGEHSLRAIVQDIYGVNEAASDSMLYERRGARNKKVGTSFYGTFVKDLHAASQALQEQGWLVTSPSGRGKEGQYHWNFLAPQGQLGEAPA